LGGELKLRSSVESIQVEQDRAVGITLEGGQFLAAKRILSSAGVVETQRLCSDLTQKQPDQRPGQLTFIESISILDRQPKEAGFGETIVFYNDSPSFHWRRPASELCDVRTGVVCSPNNYQYPSGSGNLEDGVIRLTTIADFDSWTRLDDQEYQRQKMWWYDRSVASAVRFIPDFRRHVIDTDVFTPKTIRRFTSHDNGAVYGAPEKKLDGTTHLKNLFLCGTDQGFVGIVGAIVSGISMANMHCMKDS
jgi:phytoene dehydrogenase-like protein